MPPAWKELGFRSYGAYIKSRLWWNIRQLILERDGKCCQVCGAPSKTVHHIDYTITIMLGQGDQHELITLCEPCHNFVEQDKRVAEKKILLNKLLCERSSSTLDEWQVWAKQFNSDIQYSTDRIFEPRKPRNNKHKKKKVVPTKIEPIEQPQKVESSLDIIRNEIDSYIKQHKNQKKKKHKRHISEYLKNKDQSWIDSKVKYYNNLTPENIRKQLHQAFPYFIKLLLEHPNASEKLKNCIKPYIQQNRPKESLAEKRNRIEQQYQKQKVQKKAKLDGKLPKWEKNCKPKFIPTNSPLSKFINRGQS